MGEAIVGGILAAGIANADEIAVVEPDDTRRAELGEAHGIHAHHVVSSELAKEAGVAILAVKPQVVDVVASLLRESLGERSPLVVSIAAGVTTERLEALLPERTPVVRAMPNAPALVGDGVSALSAGSCARQEHMDQAATLFGALGSVVVVDEGLQNAVTGVSGSGPAYVALFIEALADGGVRNGLPPEVAYELALRTVAGTAALLSESGQSPQEVVAAVSSPGGTTVAAREALGAGDFAEVVRRAVDAAVMRARELGSQ